MWPAAKEMSLKHVEIRPRRGFGRIHAFYLLTHGIKVCYYRGMSKLRSTSKVLLGWGRSTSKVLLAAVAAVALPLTLLVTTAGAYTSSVVGSTPASGNTTVTEVVTAGSLTLSGPDATTAGAVAAGVVTPGATVLNGTDQLKGYSLSPLNVTDNTGTGAGWNETISQTTFSHGSNVINPGTSESITGGALTSENGT